MKVIAHIDADCFYVSCERIRDKSLMNRPVAVLGNQGACVIARSYEAKPFGITVGMPIWQAKALCQKAVYIKRDFQWYGVISHAMQDIFKSYSERVEFYSVDESFIDFGELKKDWRELASKMQNEILEKLGIPVSVGISMSRTLAKIGSEQNKPFGITVVNPENLYDFLTKTDVGEICGVGFRLKKRLDQVGVVTCLDYVNYGRENIKRLLHKPGEEIWYELQGKSILQIKDVRPQRKVISRGGSLWGHHSDAKYIFGFLMRNLERFCESLLKEQIEVKNFILILRSKDEKIYKASLPLPDHTNDFEILTYALKSAFKKLYVNGELYSYCHLIATDLRSETPKQLSFIELENERKHKLFELKQKINERFGLFTLRSASTAYANKVFHDKISDYEIVDIDGKICF